MNVDENPATPMRFSIRGIPTLLLFKGGQIVEQVVGLADKDCAQEADRQARLSCGCEPRHVMLRNVIIIGSGPAGPDRRPLHRARQPQAAGHRRASKRAAS